MTILSQKEISGHVHLERFGRMVFRVSANLILRKRAGPVGISKHAEAVAGECDWEISIA
jgi:hypothetical protein